MIMRWLTHPPKIPSTPDDARTVSTLGWGAYEEQCRIDEERRKLSRKRPLDPDEVARRKGDARRKREFRRARKNGRHE